MGEFEITKREVLVSVAIFFLMLAIGFLISQNIASSIDEKNEVYNKALKIDNIDTYNYAKTTNVGNSFTIYVLDADEPQSVPELTGEYLYIQRVYEEEHEKEREVEVDEYYTDSEGNRKTRKVKKKEKYWEWDTMSRDTYVSSTVTINGEQFPYSRISGLGSHTENLNEDTVTSEYSDRLGWSSMYLKRGSHKRWSFYVIPTHSEGSMYVDLGNSTIRSDKIKLHQGTSPSDLYNQYLSSPTAVLVVFWLVWIILTGALIYGYCYFENDYLEDGSSKISIPKIWRKGK